MSETRTEYLARISAEFPGAYGRIDDLMRQWDQEHPDDPETVAARDGLPPPAPAADTPARASRRAQPPASPAPEEQP